MTEGRIQEEIRTLHRRLQVLKREVDYRAPLSFMLSEIANLQKRLETIKELVIKLDGLEDITGNEEK